MEQGQSDIILSRSPGTFLFVVNNGPADLVPADTDRTVLQVEKGRKRPHHKSRHGCLACKQRRVKCDERSPCLSCTRRGDDCIYPRRSRNLRSPSPAPLQPSTTPVSDDIQVNLLHLELLSHFQRDIIDTLAFPIMWPQILSWSFQEHYIMCAILCLSATHLSFIRPQDPRYARVSTQLLGRSVSMFGNKLHEPITSKNSEPFLAVSILIHYLSWSHIDFLNHELPLLECSAKKRNTYSQYLLFDPLLQLSPGARGVSYESFRVLLGSDSVFLTAAFYSPRHSIEEVITRHGENPWRFVEHFMQIWDDPQYQPLEAELHSDLQSHQKRLLICPCATQTVTDSALGDSYQAFLDSQRAAFEKLAKRLSLLFCITFMSPLPDLAAFLRRDIEHLVFTFPIHYSSTFRDLAFRGDPRLLIMLYHFYRAARTLLTGPTSWWAQKRNELLENTILEDLNERGIRVQELLDNNVDLV
ncbi:hypothetical protein F5Y16DRAFT_363502 [Xylariaceae sp. FL0255]|nr:hypothetical protein F5Y16DRAFT_363502 [Xylariaceae sp. FL0255]